MIGEVRSADGLRVRYDVYGGGVPALVFVHGWSCDRSYWRRQVGHFAGRFRVVAVDLAGHGESELGRAAWTMPSFGDDVVAVVSELDVRDMVLVGHSMGGDVIVEVAHRLPELVRGLVWVDTYRELAEPGTDEAADNGLAAFMAPFRADFGSATHQFVRRLFRVESDPDLVEWVAADMAAAPVEVALDSLSHAVTNEPAAIRGLRAAAVPVIAINPDQPPTNVRSLARRGVKAVLLPAVGHFVMLEDPVGFNRLLDGAIQEFPAPRQDPR